MLCIPELIGSLVRNKQQRGTVAATPLRSDFEEDEDEDEEEVAKQALQNTTYIRLTGECMYVRTYLCTYTCMYIRSPNLKWSCFFVFLNNFFYKSPPILRYFILNNIQNFIIIIWLLLIFFFQILNSKYV